jgi:hypothetical protein
VLICGCARLYPIRSPRAGSDLPLRPPNPRGAAVAAGKASLIPRYGPHPAPTPAKHEALKLLDGIAKRLAQEGRG